LWYGATVSPNVRSLGLLFAFAILFACAGGTTADAKKVVILHSFGRDFKPWSEYATSIRSELLRQSPWQLDITEHSIVSARSGDQASEAAFVAYLGALFADQAPDLIVSVGAPAAAFVQRHRPQLFAKIPMVLTAVDERRVQFTALSEHDAAVPVRIDYLGAIENILQVLPDTKNVMVVVGTSPIEKYWMEEIAKSVKPLSDRISFTWTNNLSFEQVLQRAATLPANSAIFWELMIVDAAGVVHEGSGALESLHAVSNAPIFSYDESFFGREIVGGPLLKVLDSSRQTAAVGIRMMGGEKAGDIKSTPVTFSTPIFDWREMQRWGISESRLPTGSEILFREPTAWERYRWSITGIFAALLLQMALIAWLLGERHLRQRTEQLLRSRMLEMIHLNRSAAAGAMSASFAHELSQPLAAIAMNTDAAIRLVADGAPDDKKVNEALADIQIANQHALNIMRYMRGLLKRKAINELQSFNIDTVVADAVVILSAEAQQRRIALNVEYSNESLRVRADPVQLQQVILNLALNGMDAMADITSHPRSLTIETKSIKGARVEVAVADTGKGIQEGELGQIFEKFYTTKPQGTGLGLFIAQYIVESYKGRIWAENRASGGAIFRFSLPLDDAT
jgi:signal transduction histidine kinase